MSTTPVITILGAGRIAWHLGRRLRSKGLPVTQVVSRTVERARTTAEALGATYTDKIADIDPATEWLIVAVKDDAIDDVAAEASAVVPHALVTHTSGATPGTVLAPFFKRHGVFYPLQTFSLERQPVWSKIPFCIDAVAPDDLLMLRKTAKIIGNLVYQVNDEQRAMLHVAAVFANNFTNHCFALADQILQQAELPMEMLHPLMEETLAKALTGSPANMQTGPAIRGDMDTMNRHIALLKQDPKLVELYQKLSESIGLSIKPYKK
jgi:predicted short-subunit dehydrogenase-like oxidoreductase (DUF2520 family)